jgi:putative serine protease PepD
LSLVAQIRERSVGDSVTLKILRDGQSKDISVTLITKPTTNQ